MWRDIDSLRKQNESTKKEIEQTEIETEQLRSETEILRRQNKALALIESRGLDALLKEASIPGHNDSKHPEDHLDLELLEEKLLALGCDIYDVPFLFDVLELTKAKELRARRLIAISAPSIRDQASRCNNSRIRRDPRNLRDLREFIEGPNQNWARCIDRQRRFMPSTQLSKSPSLSAS
jgi:hypothetical protein